jgi:RNA polymerase sigma-70 factor (sigma-E family)
MEFSDYVRMQRPALMRFATVLTGQTWLADDLVSDVLGKAFERWDKIGKLALPHAYVRRMIVNEHLSWRRRLQRRAPSADVEDRAGHVADSADEHAERDAMIARLRRLPPRQRTAIVLRYYAGMSDAEIAGELGCRVSTVRSQISRALSALRIDTTNAIGQRAVETLEIR